jgi:ppGpp synthetase/RelA/SpoT-type nucleotidyltranferase
MDTLLHDLLNIAGLRVHSVTTRVKSKVSFERKLNRLPGKYQSLSQITDCCGIRIITYFEDEVQDIAALIEREFSIDAPNSLDKRQTIEVDQFGYLSVHYVVTVNDTRANLAEYARFAGIKFEIQIRSILQHAWAEIEHDLEYKNPEGIPREIRRRFARLAGLLEVADAEFIGIRDAINKYQARVEETITHAPEEILVDQNSLEVLSRNNTLVKDLVQRIAELLDASIEDRATSVIDVVGVLLRTDLKTISDVEKVMRKHRVALLSFAAAWINHPEIASQPPSDTVGRGISFYYLALYMLARLESAANISTIITHAGLLKTYSPQELAREILEAYRNSKVRATGGKRPSNTA